MAGTVSSSHNEPGLDAKILLWTNTSFVHPWLDTFCEFTFKFRWYHVPMLLVAGLPIFLNVPEITPWYFWAVEILLAISILIVITDLGTFAIRKIVKRPRPYEKVEGLRLRKATKGGDPYSFPSSHAANAAGVALFSACIAPVGAVGFYILALIICFSRVYIGKHYPSDVLFGAAFGSAAGIGTYYILISINHLIFA